MPQFIVNGELVTWGPCLDPRFPGCWFVSIGTTYNHATYIMDPRANAEGILMLLHTRGIDRNFLASIAIAVLGST